MVTIIFLSLVCKQDTQKAELLLPEETSVQPHQAVSTNPRLVSASPSIGIHSSLYSSPTEVTSHTAKYTYASAILCYNKINKQNTWNLNF